MEEPTVNSVISHYRVLSKIGAGGMGEVYLTEDTRLGRKVALKLLASEFVSNDDRLRRFVQEARAAAALNHPNIAHIYEVGETDGSHFIAMEFVDGDTLTTKLHGEKSNLSTLLKFLSQVAEGLAKAHNAGIVHRDLKPDNIMITRDGYAKILDFGLAKLIEPHVSSDPSEEAATAMMPVQPLSAAGSVMGTVGYMSPEQAQGKTVDQRSDIFSFGCVLYEATTGRRPFDGDSAIDTLHKIIYAAAAPIADLNPDAPADLQRIVRRCLAKDPDKRYQTIRDVANDLEDLRREIEVDPERTVPPLAASKPNFGDASTTLSDAGRTGAQPRTTSSAEYVVSEIKQHKRVALRVLLLLLVILAGLGYFLLFKGAGTAIVSIAVLPFTNTSGNTDSEYLSDGIAETLINSLSQLRQLRVVARSTAFRYKNKEVDPLEVGRDLNVRAVMTGRVRQLGDALSIQVDLVDATTGAQLWGEEYNRKVSDVLAVKQDISREITEKLRLKLTGEERRHMTGRETDSTEAYQSYLKGRYYWNKRTVDGLKKAIEQFQQAINLDSNYALAYVGIADCYLILEQYVGTPASQTLPKAKDAAERALRIDDGLSEAHTSLAFFYSQSWQWEQAEQEFKRAISLNPNYPTAHHWFSNNLRVLGRIDEALAEIKRAQELDPLSPTIEINIGTAYYMKGDLESAMAHSKRLIELDPKYPLAHSLSGAVYLKQRRYAEAIVEFQQNVANDRSAYALADLGHAYAIGGRRDEAILILRELEEKYKRGESLGQYISAVYAGFGDLDQAFDWLERDFKSRSGTLYFIMVRACFDPLRSDPRYADLVRRMGLKP
jgi:eukaryotic-like serine/threonine-protein kinase